MKPKKHYISISKSGELSFIYDDELADLLKVGPSSITRVSNVEPCDGGWKASMKDGTILGPYPLRQQALDEEVKYLQEKLFGVKQ